MVSLEDVMVFLAGFWLSWEIFFSLGLNLLELIGIHKSWFIYLRIGFTLLFLCSFLIWRSQSKRDRMAMARIMP